jgi:hypothetical protein
MHVLGKLLVIWGVLLPAIAFPWMRDFDPERGVLGSVRWMFADFAGNRLVYAHVLSAGLVMVGLGLSLLAARRGQAGALGSPGVSLAVFPAQAGSQGDLGASSQTHGSPPARG